jgi:hypothetical protein
MRKVQADDIDASADQIAEDGNGIRGRTQCGHNLCAALKGGINQTIMLKRQFFSPGKVGWIIDPA